MPALVTGTLESVQTALLDNRKIQCRYYAFHRDRICHHTLSPLGLVQRGAITYLLATIQPYQDVRQFVLHRISQVEILDQRCETPEGFDLADYLAQGHMQFGNINNTIHLRAWITPWLARQLQETPLASDMQLTEEDEVSCLKPAYRTAGNWNGGCCRIPHPLWCMNQKNYATGCTVDSNRG